MRYSHEDLEIFRAVIQKKIEAAREIWQEQKDTLAQVGSNDTVDTQWQNKRMEDAPTYEFKREATIIATTQERLIHDLEQALERIRLGTYGICITTGKLIPKERLMLVPHTMFITKAKRENEKE